MSFLYSDITILNQRIWIALLFLVLLPSVSVKAAPPPDLSKFVVENIHFEMSAKEAISVLKKNGYWLGKTHKKSGGKRVTNLGAFKNGRGATVYITHKDNVILAVNMNINIQFSGREDRSVKMPAEKARLSKIFGEPKRACMMSWNSLNCRYNWKSGKVEETLEFNASSFSKQYKFSRKKLEVTQAKNSGGVKSVSTIENGERTGFFSDVIGGLVFDTDLKEVLRVLESAGYAKQKEEKHRDSTVLHYTRPFHAGEILAVYGTYDDVVTSLLVQAEYKGGVNEEFIANSYRVQDIMVADAGKCQRSQRRASCIYTWYDNTYSYRLEADMSAQSFRYSIRRKKMNSYEVKQREARVTKKKKILAYLSDLGGKKNKCEIIRNWTSRLDIEISTSQLRQPNLHAYRLFTDDGFIKLFGKPHDKMTEAEITSAYKTVIYPCYRRERNKGAGYLAVVNIMGSGKQYRDQIVPFINRMVPQYREALLFEKNARKKMTEYMTQANASSFDAIDGLLSQNRDVLELLWSSDRAAFVKKIQSTKTVMASAVLGKELDVLSGDISSVKQLQSLHRLLQNDSKYMRLIAKKDMQSFRNKYQPKLDKGVASLLEGERQVIDSFSSDLAGLKASKQWFWHFNANYAAYFNQPAVSDTRKYFEKKRSQVLAGSRKALEQAVSDSKSDGQLEGLLAEYLQVGTDNSDTTYLAVMNSIDGKRAEFNQQRELAKYSVRERSLMKSFRVLTVPKKYSEPSAEEMRLALMRSYARRVGGRVEDPHTVYTQASNLIMGLAGIVLGLEARFEEVRKRSCTAEGVTGGYICNYRVRTSARYDDETAALMTSWGGTRAQAEMPLKLIQGISNMLDAVEESRSHFVLTQSGWSTK